MQKDAKKERDAKKALGYKHEWIDTRGHSHRVFFDKKTLEKPKTTWTALIAVAVLAFLIGGVVLLTVPAAKNGGTIRPNSANSKPAFAPQSSLTGLTAQPATALAAGWNGEFFLADRAEIALFDANGKKIDAWPNATGETPTALSFVANEGSAKNGLLLIAYPNRVDAISFNLGAASASASAPETENENETENANVNDSETVRDAETNGGNAAQVVVRTAAGGALGPATTVLSIPNAEISGVATSDERLFVADRKSERVWRYSWAKLDALNGAESKETAPDGEIGAPDPASGYPGLRPAIGTRFNVVYSPANNEIFVANSGLFRVDAFNADSAARVAEHSWAKAPGGSDRAFGGMANPVAVVVSSNGWLATVEQEKAANGADEKKVGQKSPLQIFEWGGNWIAEIPTTAKSDKNATTAPFVAAALSADSRRLLTLSANGAVDVFVQP